MLVFFSRGAGTRKRSTLAETRPETLLPPVAFPYLGTKKLQTVAFKLDTVASTYLGTEKLHVSTLAKKINREQTHDDDDDSHDS